MKKWAFAIVLLVVSHNSFASAIDTLARTKEIITAIQKKYAPDKRTNIFIADIESTRPLRIEIETTVQAALDDFKSVLGSEKIRATIVESMLPAKELGNLTYGIINLSVVNNRVTPANQAELATQTLLGTAVKILKKQSGYFYVRTPDNYLSWVSAEGVRQVDEAGFKNYLASEKIVYTEEFGHTYEKPSAKSAHISDIVHGDILKIEGRKKKFYKVVYPDNRVAYVPVKSVTSYAAWLARPNPDAEKLISFGKTLLGVPYLWGGTSIKGVDCSGFTKTCYLINGIVLPRDASQQALVGEKIDVIEGDTVNTAKFLEKLQPGDLMFFGNRSIGKVTHVGMYMGNGEFIHSSGLVRINSMKKGADNYNDLVSKELVVVRRMLNSIGTSEISRLDQNPFYSSK